MECILLEENKQKDYAPMALKNFNYAMTGPSTSTFSSVAPNEIQDLIDDQIQGIVDPWFGSIHS